MSVGGGAQWKRAVLCADRNAALSKIGDSPRLCARTATTTHHHHGRRPPPSSLPTPTGPCFCCLGPLEKLGRKRVGPQASPTDTDEHGGRCQVAWDGLLYVLAAAAAASPQLYKPSPPPTHAIATGGCWGWRRPGQPSCGLYYIYDSSHPIISPAHRPLCSTSHSAGASPCVWDG